MKEIINLVNTIVWVYIIVANCYSLVARPCASLQLQ